MDFSISIVISRNDVFTSICISYIFMIKFETVSRPINAIISLGKVGFLLLAEFLSQTLQN